MEKEAKETKPRANGIKTSHWTKGGIWHVDFIHGESVAIDLSRMSMAQRGHLLQHGIEARAGDKCAVGATEFPDRIERSKEAMRRMIAWRDHAYSSDDWEMKVARQSGPDVGLLVRALIALGLAQDVDSANEAIVLVQGDGERDAAIAKLWAAKDVALKVRELRDEGKTYAGNATDMLAELRKGKAA